MKVSRITLRRWLTLIIGLTVIVVMLGWFEHHQVFQPDRAMFANGSELNRAWEDIEFSSRDGLKLHAWFFPASTNSPNSDLALLYCHGNGGNMGHRLDVLGALLQTGLNVLIFDYRGYGTSEGRPSEEGTYLDAQAAYGWLRARGFAGESVICYGESLGGGVASELARREQCGGLILQSTFTSIPDIGAELFPWLPVRLLSRIQYNTRKKLPEVTVPVLVMHSRDDGLIRFSHAERNFSAAPEPKLFREISGGHNSPLTNRREYVTAIEHFLALLRALGDGGPSVLTD